MRILVLGAGGTGGYFGGRLAQGGADVTFLVRPERSRVLADQGLVIRSPLGDITLRVNTVTAETVAEAGHFDLILLSCKAYDLHSAIEAIYPAVGDGTTILPILNGLAHFPVLDQRFGADAVMGGFCIISAAKGPEGEIIHFGIPPSVVFGERDGQPHGGRAERIASAFADAEVDFTHSTDIQRDAWAKFAFLTAMAGATCLFRGTIGDIMASDDGRQLTERMYEECLAVARAAGHPVPDKARSFAWDILTKKGSTLSASMLRDLESGQRMESDHLVGDMLRRARDAALPASLLEVANVHLQTFEARQKRMAGAP